ncbi:MAG: hypothetical protein AMXMBFR84_17860 [Candidatus Hydrogenedentota bacterium]
MVMVIINAVFQWIFFWLDINNFLLPWSPQIIENLFYWIDRIFL